MSSRSSAGSIIAKVLAIVVVIVLVLVILAEIGLRMFIAQQMRAGFEEQARADGIESPAEPEVSFGTSPLVFGLLSGQLNEVNMSTPSTLTIDGDTVTGQPAADVRMEGMQLTGDMLSDTVTTTTELPDDYLLATIRAQISETQPDNNNPLAEHLTVTDITSQADAGTVDVEFVHGVATLTLTPEARDGQLYFTAAKAALFGFDLPPEATDEISRALQQGMSESAYMGEGMRVEEADVIEGGLKITVVGKDVSLKQMSEKAAQ